MRIGIDIDDTITDTYYAILKEISGWYKVDLDYLVKNACKYEYFKLNYKDFKKFELETFDSFMSNVKLKTGVVETLNKLHQSNEIIIITARCKEEYSNPYEISKKYLDENNVPYDELYVEVKNKGKFCFDNRIDLFIDDNVKNCESALYYNIKTLLFDAPFNKESKLERISTWKEFEKRGDLLGEKVN